MNLEPDQWDERLDAPIERFAERHAAADVDVEAALQKVKARFNEPQVLTFPPKRSSRTFLRAAVAAIALVGGSLIWKTAQDGTSTPTAIATQAFDTRTGETKAIRLPDGSRAVLGPASHLELAAGYGDDTRHVKLSGEALFDVRHDEARPFTVRTATATIRDLGTTFSVRSIDDGAVRVAVTAGSVVLQGNRSSEADSVLLRAGDLGILDHRGQLSMHRGSVGEADTAFVKGKLVFREASMQEVAAELKRWYGIHFVVSPAIAARHLTADFTTENKEQVINVIALALGVTIELEGDTARIASN